MTNQPGAAGPHDALWTDRSFQLLFAANTISFTGSQITRVVLPILVFELTGSALQTALLLTVQTAPQLLCGLVAGAVADRFSRRVILVGGNTLNAVILAVVPVLHALGGLSVAAVYAVALAAAVTWVWTDAADFGAMPAIVGRDRIVHASTIINSTWTVAGLVALPVGGLLAATVGPATTITLDAVSYLASAVALACIRAPFQTGDRARDRDRTLIRRIGADIWAGLRYITRHPLIGPLTVLAFLGSLTGGAVLALLVVYGVRQLGLSDQDARLGWLYAAGTAGALIAALGMRALVRRVAETRICLVGFIAEFALLVALALSTDLGVSLVVLLCWQGTQALTIYTLIALRQQLTPDALQSRVNATGRMLAAGGLPLGAALGGVLADATSIRVALLVMAVGVLGSAVLGWLSPLRRTDSTTVARLRTAAEHGT